MKYAIIKCTNTNFAVHGEYPNVDAAKVAYHQYCAALWNDQNTKAAKVKIVDEQLNTVERYEEFIYHPVEESEVSE